MSWFDKDLSRRAPAGGAIGLDGHFRRGGEFEPFYVPRQDMPQIDLGDYIALFSHLARRGIRISTAVADPDMLIFHQHVFPQFVPPRGSIDLDKPLLVSAEGYVLDGNHRAAAHKRDGTSPVVIIIPRDFKDSMKALFSFPKTYTYGESNALPTTSH